MPVLQERLRKITVLYAARTDPIRSVSEEQGKKIYEQLHLELPEIFKSHLTQDKMAKLATQGVHFALEGSAFLDEGLAIFNTLVVTTEFFEISIPRKINGRELGHYKGDTFLRGGNFNAKAIRCMNQITQALNVGPHRAGKILLCEFSPLMDDEKEKIMAHIFPNVEEKCVESQINNTFLREIDDTPYNIVVQVVSPQGQPTITVRVDVNNRKMGESLEPAEIAKIFSVADTILPEWMFAFMGSPTDGN